MPIQTFSGINVYDEQGNPAPGAVGNFYALSDTTYSTPLPATDLYGLPTIPTANSRGKLPGLRVDHTEPAVVFKSGEFVQELISIEGVLASSTAATVAVDAIPERVEQAVDEALNEVLVEQGNIPTGGTTGQVLTKNSGADRDVVWSDPTGGSGSGMTSYSDVVALPGYPTGGFPSAPHSHTASQISDATSIGRSLMTAADQQTARAAIGAGTGNGTSNLVLGTTGSTAMPGNRVFSDAEITAAANGSLPAGTVRSQLAALDSRPSGGTGAVYEWRYASGAYPALPSAKPSGIQRVQAYGPVQPTSIPSWIGTGTNQAILFYDWAPLT